MRTFLLPLLPLLASCGTGVDSQSTDIGAPPVPSGTVILVADQRKQAPKTSPPAQQFRVTPVPPVSQQPRLLVQPRFTTPVIQHDLSRFPMPVTSGNGQPVRIPVVAPKQPFER